jgi:uncharacterized membrane protein YeiH
MSEIFSIAIIAIIAIITGTLFWKYSKIGSSFMICVGLVLMLIMCDSYLSEKYKSTLPVKIEQEVRIITYKKVGNYTIPIDTVEFKKQY